VTDLLAPARPAGAGVASAQLADEVAHWRFATDALADLDVIASPAAWASMEEYLRLRLRDRLTAAVAELRLQAAAAGNALAAERPHAEVRRQVLALRRRYLQVETILDFYGDAVNSRTNPALAAILRGLDVIAGDSLDMILRRLGIPTPPALVFLDKGLGAAIIRADVRLWDRTSLSPVAAVKLTRHNLSHPTALLHETGHQVAHLTGWTDELAEALRTALTPRSRELAEAWAGWAGELAADVHAFAQAGWAPLPALANVVDGETADVYRILSGDPHPMPWLRVMVNAAFCRSWYGAGPWDTLAAAWAQRHPTGRAPAEAADLARLSVAALDDITRVCTRRPMAAFGGQPLHAVADPRRVSPAALDSLARQAGGSLLTSQYLARREPLGILSLLSTRPMADPANAAAHRLALQGWLARLAPTI
jgi:hypothetical protein